MDSMFWPTEASLYDANHMLGEYIGVFFLAFIVTLVLTPVMRGLAVRNRIVDRPDQQRKSHQGPVAYLGGVAIFLGWLGGVLCSYFLVASSSWAVGESVSTDEVSFPLSVVFGATVIMLIGLIDDVYGIRPRVKIGGQFLAAAALSWSGQNLGTTLVTDTLAMFGLQIPWLMTYTLGTMLIAMLVVGGCNSTNLIDGLDGLAAGVTMIAALGFLYLTLSMAVSQPDPAMDPTRVVMCLALLGALLGFLPYNFNPASIFMGDAGSHLLGYLSVSTILMFAHADAHAGPKLVLAGLIIFALPILDTCLAIARRMWRAIPISQPDHEHLHHRVLQFTRRLKLSRNNSVRLAVLIIYGLAFVFAILGCMLVVLMWWQVLLIFIFVVALLVVGICKPAHSPILPTNMAHMDGDPKAIKPEPR